MSLKPLDVLFFVGDLDAVEVVQDGQKSPKFVRGKDEISQSLCRGPTKMRAT